MSQSLIDRLKIGRPCNIKQLCFFLSLSLDLFFSVWFLLSPKPVLTAGLLFDFDNLVCIITDFCTRFNHQNNPNVGGTSDQSAGVRTLKARGGLVAQAHGSTGSPLALVISCVANMMLILLKKSE